MTRPYETRVKRFALLVCLGLLVISSDAMAQTLEERIQKGRQLYQEGQLEQALAELQQALEEAPESVEALYFTGMTLGRLRRFDEAFDLLTQASKLDSGNAAIPSGNALIHQGAMIAAFQGQRFEDAWDQAILAAQSGQDMSAYFKQIEAVSPRPDDFDARLAAPRVFVADLDMTRLITGDLSPSSFLDTSSVEINRAQQELPEIRRLYILALVESRHFAVVNQVALATHVLLVQADSFEDGEINGYFKLVHPTSSEEIFSRQMSLSDITTPSAIRSDVALHIKYLETWLEQQGQEQRDGGR